MGQVHFIKKGHKSLKTKVGYSYRKRLQISIVINIILAASCAFLLINNYL